MNTSGGSGLKVVELVPDRTAALKVVDDLRARVVSGEIVAFAAVGITRNDSALMWLGTSEKKTNLQVAGAIATLQMSFQHGLIK